MTAAPVSAPAVGALLADETAAGLERHEAELLLLHVLGRERGWLFAHADAMPEPTQAEAFRALCARRRAGEPVAYLTGSRGFWTLELTVNKATLIPRPETELLVELALARIDANAPARIADLGTGSGAIALAIASERPFASVIATDESKFALAVAVGNAERNGIDNVWFRRGDWYEALGNERFDVIVSNPPYIEANDEHLQQGDLRFEPAMALASGTDGLDAIRVIVRDASKHLARNGWLLLEHGWNQGEAIRELLSQAGFVEVATERDLEDRERVTRGRVGFPAR